MRGGGAGNAGGVGAGRFGADEIAAEEFEPRMYAAQGGGLEAGFRPALPCHARHFTASRAGNLAHIFIEDEGHVRRQYAPEGFGLIAAARDSHPLQPGQRAQYVHRPQKMGRSGRRGRARTLRMARNASGNLPGKIPSPLPRFRARRKCLVAAKAQGIAPGQHKAHHASGGNIGHRVPILPIHKDDIAKNSGTWEEALPEAPSADLQNTFPHKSTATDRKTVCKTNAIL